LLYSTRKSETYYIQSLEIIFKSLEKSLEFIFKYNI